MEQQQIIADYDREFSWHNYNESQTKEKALFVNLLRDLCKLVEEPTHQRKLKVVKNIWIGLGNNLRKMLKD